MKQTVLFESEVKTRRDAFEMKASPFVLVDGKAQLFTAEQLQQADRVQRVKYFYRFAQERHAVYLRRALGNPKPWTDDWIIQNHRFTNVYRELDTVTEWFVKNVIQPHEDHEFLWFMLAACRVINWPDTINDMMKRSNAFANPGFNPDVAYEVLCKRKADRQKVFTGAYLVNSVAQEGDPDHVRGDKAAFVVYKTLGSLWKSRHEFKGMFKSDFKTAAQTLMSSPGFGPFTTYQVVVDLSYSKKWLKSADDYNQFNLAGPGTCRGLSRVFEGRRGAPMTREERLNNLRVLWELANERGYWTVTSNNMRNGFAPLSLSNISNLCCEFDKYARLVLDEGQMKNKYDGAKQAVWAPKRGLFK